jgi:hypothetical protein
MPASSISCRASAVSRHGRNAPSATYMSAAAISPPARPAAPATFSAVMRLSLFSRRVPVGATRGSGTRAASSGGALPDLTEAGDESM